jgi:hypothetical protein
MFSIGEKTPRYVQGGSSFGKLFSLITARGLEYALRGCVNAWRRNGRRIYARFVVAVPDRFERAQ